MMCVLEKLGKKTMILHFACTLPFEEIGFLFNRMPDANPEGGTEPQNCPQCSRNPTLQPIIVPTPRLCPSSLPRASSCREDEDMSRVQCATPGLFSELRLARRRGVGSGLSGGDGPSSCSERVGSRRHADRSGVSRQRQTEASPVRPLVLPQGALPSAKGE